jgi:hypothetical protein
MLPVYGEGSSGIKFDLLVNRGHGTVAVDRFEMQSCVRAADLRESPLIALAPETFDAELVLRDAVCASSSGT